jgi:F0F1-type ATP synthase assembly protein I
MENNRFLILKQALLFSASSIVGPVVFFGGIGWLLDHFFHTGRIFLFLSVAVAFIATHVLMFRKLQMYSKEINKISAEHDTQNDTKENIK